jgi:hypothetical protein
VVAIPQLPNALQPCQQLKLPAGLQTFYQLNTANLTKTTQPTADEATTDV